MGDGPSPERARHPWANSSSVGKLLSDTVTDEEASAARRAARLADATQPNAFTGAGGLGSFGGEFYDVRVTNKGMQLAHARSIPIFGSSPVKPLDYRKMYHGAEFEEGKRGGYAGNRFYDVRVTDTGTPRDIGRAAKHTPIFGRPTAKVVDRSKFYEGKEWQVNKKGLDASLPGPYDVRVTKTGTPRDIALAGRNTPIMGKKIYAPSKQQGLRPKSAPSLQKARAADGSELPPRRPSPAAQPALARPGSSPGYAASTLSRRGVSEAPDAALLARSTSAVLTDLACSLLGPEGSPQRAEYFTSGRRRRQPPRSGPVIFGPVWR